MSTPGLAEARLVGTDGEGLIEPLVVPEPESRTVRGPPLVLCKYQKLNAYGWFVTRAGEIFW